MTHYNPQVSPTLNKPVRELWELEATRDALFMLAGYDKCFEWRGFSVNYPEAKLIDDIANNRHDLAFVILRRQGTQINDISEQIAKSALANYIERGERSFKRIPAFCILHIPDADQQVADAARDDERETARIQSERTS